ncbi:MAG: hypothetical protein CVU06_08310 [Bacteroidetes bacterium HGW-Bacteroidetes-22]|nr:MAG: hypothetical protein CVU06_08310 [Bacteroidetes bacterium HGW-Bacteroidetes-22]
MGSDWQLAVHSGFATVGFVVCMILIVTGIPGLQQHLIRDTWFETYQRLSKDTGIIYGSVKR